MFELFKNKNKLNIKYINSALGLSEKMKESEVIKLIRSRGVKYFKDSYSMIDYPNTQDFKSRSEWKKYILNLSKSWFLDIKNIYNLNCNLIVTPDAGFSIYLTSLCKNNTSFIYMYGNEGFENNSYTIDINDKAPNNYKKSYLHNVILHELTHIICDELNYSDDKFESILSELIARYKKDGLEFEKIKYSNKHFNFLTFSSRLRSLNNEFVNTKSEDQIINIIKHNKILMGEL